MHAQDNKPNDTIETDETQRLQQAFKQDRLGGWPSIIGIVGIISLFLNMVFNGTDAYINIGSTSVYLWKLLLYCSAITFAFLPASIKDAKCLAAGEKRPSIVSFSKRVIIRLLISIVAIIIIHQFV